MLTLQAFLRGGEMIPAHRRVTVVIPTIPGREQLLNRALLSVLNQKLFPFHVVIIRDDDGLGATWARNQAIPMVNTEWIAWLDDDDEFLPDHLRVLVEKGEEYGADLVYPGMEVVGGKDPTAVAYNGQWINPFGVTFGLEQERHLRVHGNFIPITHLVRTKFARMVNGFPDPQPNVPEDHGYLIRLLDVGARFVHVPERTWRYHMHDANTGGVTRHSGTTE